MRRIVTWMFMRSMIPWRVINRLRVGPFHWHAIVLFRPTTRAEVFRCRRYSRTERHWEHHVGCIGQIA